MKTKLLALLLVFSMMIAAFPIISFAAEPSGEIVIFEEDFDTHNETPKDLENNGAAQNYSVETHDGKNHAGMDDQGNYGSFKYGNWHKIGWNLDTKYQGIKHGKVHIVFDFSSSQPTSAYNGSNAIGVVGLGQTDVNHETLSLINVIGKRIAGGNIEANDSEENITRGLYTLGLWSKATKVSPDYTITNDKWYHYDGTVDLDTHAYSFTVTPLDTQEKSAKGEAKYSTNSIPAGGGALSSGESRWTNWPTAELTLNAISITEMLDVDNIKILYTPIQPTFGAKSSDVSYGTCSIYSDTVTLNFAQKVTEVQDGAITFGSTPVTGVRPAEDGMSCTFDIPEKETLISGKEYTIKVDKSKITTEDDKYIGDDTAELKFNVDEWKQSVYHQDFSDASLKAKNFTGGTEQDADEGWFEAKDGVGVFNGTPYGYKRVGLPINNQGANRGLVKVKFKFMRPAGATGDPFITIGRERSGSILHVVTLLTINNTSKEAGVLSNSVADDRKLKNGETALTVKDGEWYDYEALIDMDKRTFEAKVTGKGNSDSESRTYTYSSTPMTRDAEDKTNKWTYWPFVTEMNDFMVMNGLIHIDDIDISYSTDLSLTKSDSGFEAKAVAHNTGKNTLLLEQLGETGILKKAYLKQAELGEGQAAVLKQSGAWEGDAAKAKAVIWQDTDNIIPLSKKAEISK